MIRIIQTSKNLLKLSILKDNIIIGNSNSIVLGSKAVINNIFIDKKYRNQKYGSQLLYETEKKLNDLHSVTHISLSAWEKQGCHVSDFYLKNGYKNILSDISKSTHDDGIYIYNIIPFEKNL